MGSLGRSTHGEGFQLLPLALLSLPTSAFALFVLWGAGSCCTWSPSILYPGPVGPLPPQGPKLLFPFLWLSGQAPASVLIWLGWHWLFWGLGWELDTRFSIQSFDPVVTLGFPACTFWASVPTSLQGEDWCLHVCVLSHFSHVRLVACQAPLSMGFSRQEYWSGLPCPPPGDRLHSGMEPLSLASPALQADSLPLAPPGKPQDFLVSSRFSPTFCES